jgi:thiol-disulfide isomerase/thioredoxin
MNSYRSVLATLGLWLAASLAPTAQAADASDALLAYRGQVTYVDFWASWCGPCAESFPWLNAMQVKYAKQGLHIVGVGVDTDAANAERFLKQHPPQFPIAADPAGKLAEHYDIKGMPYAVLLDADGNVLHRHAGFRAADTPDYEQHIKAALAATRDTK